MKQILKRASILFLISFSLLGCASKEQKLLKDVEKYSGIQYLSSAKIVFSYAMVNGFEDKAGPVYYVLDFTKSNKKQEFVNQYCINKKDESSDFKASLKEFVDKEIGGAYYLFDSQYQIDLDEPYFYYHEEKLYLIYLEKTDIAYFVYHLWIP